MAEVLMPRLSDTMADGTIVRWLKRHGEEVTVGEDLVDIETDKTTVTFQAEEAGPLNIVAREGATMAVGTLIAYIGDPHHRNIAGAGSRKQASEKAEPPEDGEVSAQRGGLGLRSLPGINASPTARRLAGKHGIDLGSLVGTGPDGRITRADVAVAIEADSGESADPRSARPPALKGLITRREATRAQRLVAERMTASAATIPEFTIEAEFDVARVQEWRLAPSQRSADDGSRPSMTDVIVRASGIALRDFPSFNGAYRDGALEFYSRVNIGLAMAVNGSLVVPTIADCDQKSLAEIATERRSLSRRALEGTLRPADLEGATFTISNLGTWGITRFRAIIPPDQTAILAVGAIRRVLCAGEEESVVCPLMSVTLSCDHRMVYGAEAGDFLSRLGDVLTEPRQLGPRPTTDAK